MRGDFYNIDDQQQGLSFIQFVPSTLSDLILILDRDIWVLSVLKKDVQKRKKRENEMIIPALKLV